MPTTQKLRERLIKKLKELFQLDQPDLDFGFYRVMHAKAEQVETFLDKDLLKIVTDAFGQVDDTRKAQLQAEYEKAIEQAKKYGAPDPEDTDAVKEAKAALNAAKDTVNAEGEIYDHLYRFFERYYDGGDFLSKRYYTRETSGKAAPFAVPYNGEEVKLHWANADQYYIKTAEYFTNYCFDLATGAKLQLEAIKKNPKQIEMDFDKYSDMPETLKVHFKIIEASEGEHGNVKASEATKRFFVIHKENPVELDGNGELVCNFEYRPDPEKGSKQEGTWRQHRNNEATAEILKAVEKLENADEYVRLLSVPAPTDKEKGRPLLAKYINQYTARNTMDYFIHKDLDSFLSRELDFYIKNEVMRLDDIENADSPAVESYLAKIKVLRKIAGKLIDFLAQLEEFQKKLWLKKKFVTETNYCITLDRVPEELYEEIVINDAQRQEWIKLFAIDEIKTVQSAEVAKSKKKKEKGTELFADQAEVSDNETIKIKSAVGYTAPVTVDFLKDNPFLVLDTKFFGDDFKDKLIESIENFDEKYDGLLIHSENFQALNLLQEQYDKQVRCIYIDPPYNTNATPILYKNEFKSSSWATLIANRLQMGFKLLSRNNSYGVIAIDDHELTHLSQLVEQIFPMREIHRVIVNHYPGSGTGRSNVTRTHEYALFLTPEGKDILRGEAKEEGWRERGFCRSGTGENNYRVGRPNSFYAVLVDEASCEIRGFEKPPEKDDHDYPCGKTSDGYLRIYPTGQDGSERCWSLSYESAQSHWKHGLIKCTSNLVIKRRYFDEESRNLLPSVWLDKKFSAVTYGTNILTALFGDSGLFSYPKSLYTVATAIEAGTYNSDESLILDFFSGSGTTGHAVINLNRDNGSNHKYILVEMGDYFDEVTKPRIQKVAYAVQWKNGKPQKIPDYINSLKKKITDLKKELKDLKGIDEKAEYEFESQKIRGEIEDGQLKITLAEDQYQEGNEYLGVSQCFKYIRLESYEDTLNNLVFADNTARDKVIAENASLREDYMLGYMLDTETRGSQSLLNIDSFADPCSYQLTVKKPGTDEYDVRNVDLLETFNYLIGLRVEHIAAPQTFNAKFKREPDPELPEDQNTRLILEGKLKQNEKGQWWFRKVEGWVPSDSNNPNNGQKEKVLIVWRKLTGDLEEDNLMLDEWFQKNRISTRDFEFDTIYVNGSNNLPNLMLEGDNWKVRLIEEDFMKNMWDVDNI